MLCSIVKAVSRFRPNRIVMHACLRGNYLNKLDKVMSWSLNSLNFKYYNHSLLSYNHSQFIHSLPWEASSGSNFSRTIFQILPKETAKYHCFALALSILHSYFRMIIFLLQRNLSTDLLVFIKLKFLRILNFSLSFQEPVMTYSSCSYTIWERKKTGYSCVWI